jgi:hypothetical protein
MEPLILPGDIMALREALHEHRSTLHTICITNLTNRGEVWMSAPEMFSFRDFAGLSSLEIEMPLWAGGGGQNALRNAIQELPVRIKNLTVHTYMEASDLVIFILSLHELQSQGIECFKVTFPHIVRVDTDSLNENFPAIFCSQHNMLSKGRRFFVGYEEYPGAMRATFQCWDLQQWSAWDITELVRSGGIDGLVQAQLSDVWEDEVGMSENSLTTSNGEDAQVDNDDGGMELAQD